MTVGRARRTPRFCYKASAAQETQCRCLHVAQDETCQMQASRDQVRGWPAGYLPPNGLFDIEAPQHPVFPAYKLGLRCPPRSPTYVVALYCPPPPTLLSPSAPLLLYVGFVASFRTTHCKLCYIAEDVAVAVGRFPTYVSVVSIVILGEIYH